MNLDSSDLSQIGVIRLLWLLNLVNYWLTILRNSNSLMQK